MNTCSHGHFRQKKTVSVYRIIVKDTLEEKIMGLQRFKLNMAQSVVNEENADNLLQAQDVLELFQSQSSLGKRKRKWNQEQGVGMGIPAVTQELVEALDQLSEEAQSEYAQAFDLENFVKK